MKNFPHDIMELKTRHKRILNFPFVSIGLLCKKKSIVVDKLNNQLEILLFYLAYFVKNHIG